MSKCYICNREMLDSRPDGVNEEDKGKVCLKHNEHIIHNAIGGKLKSDQILCEKCGGEYSQDDKRFADVFQSLITLMSQFDQLRKPDHSDAKSRPVKGVFRKPEGFPEGFPDTIEVVLKNNKEVPVTPDWCALEDKKQIYIWCDAKLMKNFRKKVEHDLQAQNKHISDYTVNEITDLKGEAIPLFYFSKGNPNFNDAMNHGLIKIAVEFALHYGIPREDLTDALSIDSTTGRGTVTYDKVQVIPYISLSIIDAIFENERERYEGDTFPSHSLKLFSQTYNDGTKALYCFIDLFSTFQYYVVLNGDYKGKDVDEVYAHTLKKNDPKTYDDIENYRWKDLDIVMRENGISRDEITGKNLADAINYIKHRLQTKPATFSLNSTMCKAYERIKNEICAYMAKRINPDYPMDVNISDSTKTIIDLLLDNYTLSPQDIEQICDMHKENYRKSFWEIKDSEYELKSYPDTCLQYFKDHRELAEEYHTSKFSKISSLCRLWSGLV